ncbi:MAG: hypothetical protein KIS92_22520 [Planctomycetota bacterium]|nr:hypothetical protein [Planctomycetota bacterium]
MLLALSGSWAAAEEGFGSQPETASPPPIGGAAVDRQPFAIPARKGRVAPPAPVDPAVPAVPALTQALAVKLAAKFYATKGEWAGAFVITKVTRIKLVDLGRQSYRAFMDYDFQGIGVDATGSNRRGETGSDSRTFDYVYDPKAGEWVVASMGTFQSGKE